MQRQSQRPERQPFVGSERQPGDERQAESADQDQEYERTCEMLRQGSGACAAGGRTGQRNTLDGAVAW